eukprot:756547-Hanusia_phi.AAC.2
MRGEEKMRWMRGEERSDSEGEETEDREEEITCFIFAKTERASANFALGLSQVSTEQLPLRAEVSLMKSTWRRNQVEKIDSLIATSVS